MANEEKLPRVYQQITLVYDLRWPLEKMSEEMRQEYITEIAESTQRKLKSISGALVRTVVEVRIGSCEIDPQDKTGEKSKQFIPLSLTKQEYDLLMSWIEFSAVFVQDRATTSSPNDADKDEHTQLCALENELLWQEKYNQRRPEQR